jgi:hypothetical protein
MFPYRPLSAMRSLTAMTVLGLFLYLGMASPARADAGVFDIRVFHNSHLGELAH